MLILALRTDQPDAELSLLDNDTPLKQLTWLAHRQLANTIHTKIDELLASENHTLDDIDGIVCFAGPGSFTGLRIGLSVANALAYGLEIPVVATTDEDWIERGLHRLHAGDDDRIAQPHYGADPHITPPRK